MAFSGVFERHPGLKLVFTEQQGLWYQYLLDEMDSVALMFRERGMASPTAPSPPGSAARSVA